jgi:hypothetical protein
MPERAEVMLVKSFGYRTAVSVEEEIPKPEMNQIAELKLKFAVDMAEFLLTPRHEGTEKRAVGQFEPAI